MPNSMFADLLMFSTVLWPAMFLFFARELEKRGVAEGLFSRIAELLFFSLQLALTFTLSFKLSEPGLSALRGILKIDHLMALNALLLVGVTALVRIYRSPQENRSLNRLDVFLFLSLATGLIFSNSLIFIFIFSEVLLLKALLPRGHKFGVLDFKGTTVRLVGLVLLLGSAAFNGGGEGLLTLNFIKSNLSELYSSDHLFVLGALFLLAGLLEFLWTVIMSRKWEQTMSRLFACCGLVVLFFKYSSSGLFTVLEESQSLLQWIFVLAFLYKCFCIHQERNLKLMVGHVFSINTLLALVFSLPLILDGQGATHHIYIYFFSSLVPMLVLFSLEEELAVKKGEGLVVGDLKSLVHKQPRRSVVLICALICAVSFPLSPGALVMLPAVSSVLKSGFYWVVMWTLMGFAALWPLVIMVVQSLYSSEQGDGWLLWRSEAFDDFSLRRLAVQIVLLLASPALVSYLFNP